MQSRSLGYNPAQYIAHAPGLSHANSPRLHDACRTAPALAAPAPGCCAAAGRALADDYADVNQLLRSGKTAEALAKADQYLAGKPKDPQMRFLKGVIQTEAGRKDDAIATFTQAHRRLP